MLHSIKGSIPLRLSGIYNAKIENVKIEKIDNFSNYGSDKCGNY